MRVFTSLLTNDEGRTYAINLEADGSWRCDCPSWKFQHKPNHQRTCKHMVELVMLLGNHIVDAESGVESTL